MPKSIFVVESKKGKRIISPAKLSSIAITATVELSSDAIILAISNQIPILFFNYIGKAKARLWSPYFESIATLRRNQVRFAEMVEATAWLINIFGLKSTAQLDNLKYLKTHTTRWRTGLDMATRQIKQQTRNFEAFRGQLPDECRQQLMGTEGGIARVYWQAIGSALPRKYAFLKRSRRPAEDHFNAALNYLYGMLYSVVEAGVFAAGLDPYLGVLHTDEHSKPTLVYDLIEPFRPWVDHLLIKACWREEVKKDFFTKNQHGVFLNKNGKAYFIPLFNNFLKEDRKFLNREASVKNQIYFLAGRLAQRIRTSTAD